METMTQLDLFADTTETVEVTAPPAPPTLDGLLARGGALFTIIGQAALARNWADDDWSKAWAAGYRSHADVIPPKAHEPYRSYLANANASEAYRHAALLVAVALGVEMERSKLHDAIYEATRSMADVIR